MMHNCRKSAIQTISSPQGDSRKGKSPQRSGVTDARGDDDVVSIGGIRLEVRKQKKTG